MNADEIVKALEAEILCEGCPHNGGGCFDDGCWYVSAADLIESQQAQLADKDTLLDAAIAGQETLQAQLAAQQSNEPLTLDELRGMDGEPVWESWTGSWRIVTTAHDGETTSLYNVYNSISAKSVLYNDGLIYRRPPERSKPCI